MNEKLKTHIESAEIHFFRDADPETIKDVLQECSPDMHEHMRKRDKALKKIKFLAKAAVNKQHDEKLLELADRFKDAIEKNIDKPLQVLRSLMKNQSAAYYSNLEKLTKEDIVELIKDTNLVNLLDQLDQDGTNHQSEV